mmetsp:Transcript_37637/g.84104  ORF Transcript_37637/g.84104 Transcript_37637/m.84104 type:complete len:209 (+) Transcript_37637:185-811(+)
MPFFIFAADLFEVSAWKIVFAHRRCYHIRYSATYFYWVQNGSCARSFGAIVIPIRIIITNVVPIGHRVGNPPRKMLERMPSHRRVLEGAPNELAHIGGRKRRQFPLIYVRFREGCCAHREPSLGCQVSTGVILGASEFEQVIEEMRHGLHQRASSLFTSMRQERFVGKGELDVVNLLLRFRPPGCPIDVCAKSLIEGFQESLDDREAA